jgi:hypothetical protein
VSIADLVESRLRILQSQQLITGELAAYRNTDGLACYSPYPLWSALAYDALSFLDASSSVFERSVIDLFSPAKYRVISAIICTLRWRLRTYLAWQEEADGTWRCGGRNSASPPDALTTACAAVALLKPGPIQCSNTRRHLNALRRLSLPEVRDRSAQAHMLRYFSLAGADTRDLAAAVWKDCGNRSQDAMFWYAVGRTWHGAQLSGHSEVAVRIVPRILESVPDTATSDYPETVLKICSLLDLGYRGPELSGMIHGSMTTPNYPDQTIGAADEIHCPAATVAVGLANVVRASLQIAGRRLV